MKAKHLDFTVFIERDEKGIYIAKVPDIPGCYTQGKTIAQVLDRIKEAIDVCIEAEAQEIKPLQFIGVQKISIPA